MSEQPIQGSRAPVLTLWAAVVATRVGHALDTALTFGETGHPWSLEKFVERTTA